MDGEASTALASRPWQALDGRLAVGLRAPLVGTTRAVVLAGGLGTRLRPYYGPRALRLLPREGPVQFPELVLRLLEAGERMVPFRTDAVWYDIGTICEYERALRHLERCPELLEPYV